MKEKMDIYKAIDALERIYDSNVSMMDDEEATSFAMALEVVWEFAQEYQPKVEIPDVFICSCGEHISRGEDYAGMARFLCPACGADWLIG